MNNVVEHIQSQQITIFTTMCYVYYYGMKMVSLYILH